jgi:hypothetical protein
MDSVVKWTGRQKGIPTLEKLNCFCFLPASARARALLCKIPAIDKTNWEGTFTEASLAGIDH